MRHHVDDIENFDILLTFVNDDRVIEFMMEDGHLFVTLQDGEEMLECEGFSV